jgi:hypothetical protein
MAAFVPTRRATSWQMTDGVGVPVVRERYWLTFQPGKIRSCTSCHGVNTSDQAGHPPASNPPEALRTLLRFYKEVNAAEIPDQGGAGSLDLSALQLAPTPNPFRDRIEFRFRLAREVAQARIEIFDAGGRKVATLPLGSVGVGGQVASWSGSINSGGDPAVRGGASAEAPGVVPGASEASPGIYFARLVCSGGAGRAIQVVKLR